MNTSSKLVALVEGTYVEPPAQIFLRVWHVNPDNIEYVGPYASADEAKAAADALPEFTYVEEEAEWHADGIGGSEGCVMSVQTADSEDTVALRAIPPDGLVDAVHARM